MKIQVEMWAFAEGRVREVTIPALEYAEGLLDKVFYFGQNDHCVNGDLLQKLPSVSVGDIIRLHEKRYVVVPLGFREVAADFLPPKGDRGGMYAYNLDRDIGEGRVR
jgi:hypothetical protein